MAAAGTTNELTARLAEFFRTLQRMALQHNFQTLVQLEDFGTATTLHSSVGDEPLSCKPEIPIDDPGAPLVLAVRAVGHTGNTTQNHSTTQNHQDGFDRETNAAKPEKMQWGWVQNQPDSRNQQSYDLRVENLFGRRKKLACFCRYRHLGTVDSKLPCNTTEKRRHCGCIFSLLLGLNPRHPHRIRVS